MVAEADVVRDARAVRDRIGDERVRMGKRRRHHHALSGQRRQRHVMPTRTVALDARPRVTRPRNGRPAVQHLDGLRKRRVHAVGTGHHHQASTPQRGSGFAQPTRWQQRAVDRRTRGIHQHDVEVTRDPPMLESIVKHHAIDARILRPCLRDRGHSVGTHGKRHARERRAVFLGFVGDTIARAVAAERDRRPMSRGNERLRTPAHERGLARASHRHVADADHRDADALRRPHVPHRIARTHAHAVGQCRNVRERRKCRMQGTGGSHAPRPSERSGSTSREGSPITVSGSPSQRSGHPAAAQSE